jgi:hypothetical protein
MLSRLRPLLVVVVATFAVALGLPSGANAAAAKPQVGQCHQLTWRQAAGVADATRAVACSRRHNLQTVAVVTSPDSLVGLTDDRLADLGARLCRPRVDKVLGRTAAVREQTVYSLFYFAPTPAQVAAGARWIRCDVGKIAVDHLVTLPRHRLARPVIGRHITDSERRCLTSSLYVAPCTTKHVFRSTKAFVLRQSTYPTGNQVLPRATRICPKGWDYVRWTTIWGWQHGDHVAVCYDRTRK